MAPPLVRRLGCEALGAALLTATVIGSGILAVRLAGGNDAVALLGNTLATGAMLFVLIQLFGPVSGAHFNPAVSLVKAIDGTLRPGEAAGYMLVQVAGCLAGALLAHAMFGLPLIQLATQGRGSSGEFLGEVLATFALVLTVLVVPRHRPEATATAAALVIVAGYWWTSSTSFANPAITVARAFSDTFAGISPAHVPGFVAAQIGGALLAFVAARVLGLVPGRD